MTKAPKPYLIPAFLPRSSMTLLRGSGRNGKSKIVLDLSVAIAAGKKPA